MTKVKQYKLRISSIDNKDNVVINPQTQIKTKKIRNKGETFWSNGNQKVWRWAERVYSSLQVIQQSP